jgi:putative transposase
LNSLYQAIGISKQAVNQYARRQGVFDARLLELVAEAEVLRRQHPGCGVEKMYYQLAPEFIGRDRFIEVMMDVGFRVKRFRNYHRTTYAGLKRYPNLIKGMKVSAPFTIWQSDITYFRVGNNFYYGVFIIDVYSKKIVGYTVSKSMHATANVKALTMAFKSHPAPTIHHSDRGSQYGCHEYLSMLQAKESAISMGIKSQDNAYAERINRTIKEEYIDHWKAENYNQLQAQVKKAVNNYNNKRPHKHLNRMTPVRFENLFLTNQLAVKPIMTIFDDNNL